MDPVTGIEINYDIKWEEILPPTPTDNYYESRIKNRRVVSLPSDLPYLHGLMKHEKDQQYHIEFYYQW